jgi:threonine 3-dehydrogenase
MYALVKSKPAPGAEVKSVARPEVGEHEVLVEIRAATVCGTDVHIWEWNQWAQNRIKTPLVIGHELCGEVIEAGEKVTRVKVGDLVSAETHIADNICYQCLTGRKHLCNHMEILGVDRDGAFADYTVLPEENAWVNDPGLDPFVASIQEPLGNAVHAALPANNIEDIAGRYAIVLGCGPIGLMAIAVLKKLGASKVIATEVKPLRLEFAKSMGADLTLNPREEDIVRKVLDYTGGRGVDIVLEMSGAPSALIQGLEMATNGGRISLLGLPDNPVTIDLSNLVIFKGLRIFGITGRRMYETWYQVREFLNDGDFRAKMGHLITHKMPMKDIAEGMELINSGKAIKVGLYPQWK